MSDDGRLTTRIPWRKRPRPRLVWSSAHPLIICSLLALGGVEVTVQAVAGSGRGVGHLLLMLVLGVALIAAGFAALTFLWWYIKRPHDRSLD